MTFRYICYISLPIRRSFASSANKRFSRDVLESGNGSALEFTDARLCFPNDPKFGLVELIPRESNSNPLRIPLVWLRDHCRSSLCYNSRTNQRRSNCTDLFQRSTLAEDCYPIQFDRQQQVLRLIWADGHESSFNMHDLVKWALFSKKRLEECADEWEAGSDCPSRSLWTSDSLREIPSVSINSFDFALFARLLIRFGVVQINGVDASDERMTRALCEKISPLFGTLFGEFWTFGPSLEMIEHQNGMASFDDTAYGSEAIGPHTDGTYLDQPPGIQVFHCLKPSAEGGKTLLVDGFSAAEQLRIEAPIHFRVLSTTCIEHEYVEGNSWHARAFREPVIRQFPRAEKIAQIRFNPYDRAPMRTLRMDENTETAITETVLFYAAYQHFAQLVNSPSRQVSVQLRPGTVLFIDNFRVLHGRRAFQGDRLVCGCYLSRDTFLAKARPILSPALYKNV